jgi:hypothetical protein
MSHGGIRGSSCPATNTSGQVWQAVLGPIALLLTCICPGRVRSANRTLTFFWCHHQCLMWYLVGLVRMIVGCIMSFPRRQVGHMAVVVGLPR